jgi:cytochrome c5
MQTRVPDLRGVGRWVVTAVVALTPQLATAAEPRAGERIYKERCASCHGKAGEGTPDYPRALAGDRSVAQLSKLIAKTMPEDDPGTCVGADADNVAAFIHDAFYSPVAQARNAPARIALSRLTVRQYRNAVTDLVGSFRNTARWDDQRGLRAQYFKGRGFGGGNRVIERTDPEVKFDFKEESPGEKIEPHEFSIRWEGSVLAPDTGEYEFVVRTEHATRLWVNDLRKPLIDAWVKSGNDTEYRESVYLLGGRVYPLKLEFSKAKQGVDDSKKNKKPPKPVKASVALEWKRPRRPAEVIPRHCLTPARFPEAFVVTTPFPPDDRSVGYERGTSVSKAWDQATTDAAIETTAYVLARVRELSGAPENGPDRAKRLREFAGRFAERAFRRPLTDEQKKAVIDRQFEKAKDADDALKRVVLLVLKSPRFLYRELRAGKPDGYDVASRLSFGLWDSLPDAPLVEAAAKGKLATREQVRAQAERMAGDLRTRAKLREFFLQWLKVEQVPDLGKDPALFAGFDPGLASDLRTSLELFVDDLVSGDDADFRQILSADTLYLNGRLAKFYGADLHPDDAPFQKVSFEPKERAGVLTHPYLLATFAYTATSSPIHRGVFVARSVLGRTLRPPPVAVAPLAPDLHAGLTTRERVALQTRPQACQTCHVMINALGFPLEQFDAVGRYRKEEKGKPIDATGLYQTRSGETVTFDGARDLASFLADSDEVHSAFVDQLFHYTVKQPVRAYGPQTGTELKKAFAKNDFRLRKLLTEIVTASALTPRDDKP